MRTLVSSSQLTRISSTQFPLTMIVKGKEAFRTDGSKRAMMDDWGKRWVWYSREMYVDTGEVSMI